MQHSNPWTTRATKSVYDNPWIHVREDDVIRPDGKPGIYGVVNFKNKAIGVLPIDAHGQVYLVGQHRYPLDAYSWELPEGGCPAGEDPLAAAKRELLEETGLIAADWKLLGRAHLSNSVTDEEAFYFLATNLTQSAPQPEGTEQFAYRHITFEACLDMVANGEITDALSVLAIQSYALQRQRKSGG
jgi:8-oxo-dGTP pyrophosphatase MutT (NUDIX family)